MSVCLFEVYSVSALILFIVLPHIKILKQTYKPYTLVGPTVTERVQDPLAVVNLYNRLCMLCVLWKSKFLHLKLKLF